MFELSFKRCIHDLLVIGILFSLPVMGDAEAIGSSQQAGSFESSLLQIDSEEYAGSWFLQNVGADVNILAGDNPNLALDGDGYPRIAYQEAITLYTDGPYGIEEEVVYDLNLVSWGGTAWQVENILDEYMGGDVALSVGESGTAFIPHYRSFDFGSDGIGGGFSTSWTELWSRVDDSVGGWMPEKIFGVQFEETPVNFLFSNSHEQSLYVKTWRLASAGPLYYYFLATWSSDRWDLTEIGSSRATEVDDAGDWLWERSGIGEDLVSFSVDSVGKICALSIDENAQLMYSVWDGAVLEAELIAEDVAGAEIFLDQGGHPHIAYWTLGGALKYGAASESGWLIEDVADNVVNASFGLDARDVAHLAFLVSEPLQLKYAYRVNGIWSQETIPDDVSEVQNWFELSLDDSAKPHMAYVNNGGGLSYATKSTQVAPPGALEISQSFSGSKFLSDNWWWSNWFGYMNAAQQPWYFHLQHGFIYVFPAVSDGLFFWDGAMESIIWTSENVYPAIYRFSDSQWLFYQEGSKNPRNFVNLITGQWEQW